MSRLGQPRARAICQLATWQVCPELGSTKGARAANYMAGGTTIDVDELLDGAAPATHFANGTADAERDVAAHCMHSIAFCPCLVE